MVVLYQLLQHATDTLPESYFLSVSWLVLGLLSEALDSPTNCATRLGNQKAEPYRMEAR